MLLGRIRAYLLHTTFLQNCTDFKVVYPMEVVIQKAHFFSLKYYPKTGLLRCHKTKGTVHVHEPKHVTTEPMGQSWGYVGGSTALNSTD